MRAFSDLLLSQARYFSEAFLFVSWERWVRDLQSFPPLPLVFWEGWVRSYPRSSLIADLVPQVQG